MFKKKYQEGVCEYCGGDKNKTQDHVVPCWMIKVCTVLNLPIPNTHENSIVACLTCNNKKGGRINVEHEVSLRFWLDLRKSINKEISNYYG